jgi:hypothetical protein
MSEDALAHAKANSIGTSRRYTYAGEQNPSRTSIWCTGAKLRDSAGVRTHLKSLQEPKAKLLRAKVTMIFSPTSI